MKNLYTDKVSPEDEPDTPEVLRFAQDDKRGMLRMTKEIRRIAENGIKAAGTG